MHQYKVILSIVGTIALWFFTPLPNPYWVVPCQQGAVNPACSQNDSAKLTGALIGLAIGFVVGAIADNLLAQKTQTSTGQTARPSDTTTSAAHPKTKQCVHCGASNQIEWKFCSACGTPFISSDLANQPKKCSKCGATNEAQFKYCGVCGTPLTIPEPFR